MPEVSNTLRREWRDLLRENDAYFIGWERASARRPKFYVGGVDAAFAMLGTTEVKPVWSSYLTSPSSEKNSGKDILFQKTRWVEELGFQWETDINDQQFRRAVNGSPMIFYKAVQAILTFEAYTKQNETGVNIFDVLDIIPASYNINDFSATKITELEEIDKDFLENISAAINQPKQFIIDLANGHCGTKKSVLAIKKYIDKYYPSHRLMEVRAKPGKGGLGQGSASSSEIVQTDLPSPNPVSRKSTWWC